MIERIQTNRRVFVLSMLAAWTAFGLFFGTQEYLRDVYRGRPGSLPGHLVSWILCGYSWGILTLPVVRIARRLPQQTLGWARFFLFHVPLASIFSLAQIGIYVIIATTLFSRDRGFWDLYQAIVVHEFQSSFLVYFVIVSAVAAYDRWFLESPAAISPEVHTNLNGNGHSFLRRFPVKENGRIVLVDIENINWIESYGNYLFLHTDDRKHIVRETMASMEKKLDPEQFVRVRRSAIIRADQIAEIHPGVNGEMEVVLRSGTTVPATRRYRKNLENFIRS